MFLLIATTIWLVFHWWIGRRLLRTTRLPRRVQRLGWGIMTLLVTTPVVATITARLAPHTEGESALQWAGYTFMGLSFLLAMFMVATALASDAPRRILRAISRLRLGPEGAGQPSAPGRRHFFTDVANLGVVGTASALTAIGLNDAGRVPEVVEIDVFVVDLPASLEGYTIVQLSDIHIGPTLRGPWLTRVVAAANALDADLAVVTGDLVDGFVDTLGPQVAPLADLEGRDGRFFVTGNHEYYWDAAAWCRKIEGFGFTVLNNAHRLIKVKDARLLVAGVTDHTTGHRLEGHRSDPLATMRGAPAHDFSILLAHQPRSIYEATNAGFDLQLSGHTHGGQFFPMSLMIGLFQPYIAGLYRHESTWLYVSRGTGYWGPPNRVGSPPEITLLRLMRTQGPQAQ